MPCIYMYKNITNYCYANIRFYTFFFFCKITKTTLKWAYIYIQPSIYTYVCLYRRIEGRNEVENTKNEINMCIYVLKYCTHRMALLYFFSFLYFLVSFLFWFFEGGLCILHISSLHFMLSILWQTEIYLYYRYINSIKHHSSHYQPTWYFLFKKCISLI